MWDVPSIEIMRLKKSVFYYFLPEIKKWLNGMEFFLLQERTLSCKLPWTFNNSFSDYVTLGLRNIKR